MFAVIHLPQFALQAVLRHEPEQWTHSVALVDPAMNTPRVIDATGPAREAGVETGLTPTQALARCRHVIIRHRSPARETSATDAALQSAYGFSPHLENTAPGVITLDLRGLAVWRDPGQAARDAWCRRLLAAFAAIGLRARVGIGPTANVARHAARWSREFEIVSDPAEFIAALPVTALEPSSDVALILHKWGIRTVGELLALGQEAVVDRLGLESLALFAAASVQATRPLRLATPPEHYAETFEFDPPVETLEPLLFLLRRFVDSLTHRLEPAGLAAQTLTLQLRLESGGRLERALHVPEPTRDPEVLFRMLHTHLETLRSDSPIIAVSLAIDPTRPEQKQFSLFEAAVRDPHQFQETLARLSALLGADRVGMPVRTNTHRADAFKLVPPDFEKAPPVGARVPELLRPVPVRKLRPVRPAEVQVDASNHEIARPVSVQCAVARGKLTLTLGPWRTSGQWWETAAWRREEWDAQTADGKVLRLVREADGWRVEGVLD
jgi:protein ImuB